MTIPSLIQKQVEKQTVVKLKKVYATLSVVQQAVVSEYGINYGCKQCMYSLDNAPSNSDFSKSIQEKWLPYLDVIRKCDASNNFRGCFSKNAYDGINRKQYGWIANSSESYLLKDGTAIKFDVLGNTGFSFVVDLNGPAGPNKFGVDTFHFLAEAGANWKIVPVGSISYSDPYLAPCKRTYENPQKQIITCGAWVLENENMDYLHCDDLERGVKTKCD